MLEMSGIDKMRYKKLFVIFKYSRCNFGRGPSFD